MMKKFGIAVTHIRPHASILFDRNLLYAIEDALHNEIAVTRRNVARNITDVNIQVVYTYLSAAMRRSAQHLRRGFSGGIPVPDPDNTVNNTANSEKTDTPDIKSHKNAKICFSAFFCCNYTHCYYSENNRTVVWNSRTYFNISKWQLSLLHRQRAFQQEIDTGRPLSESELQVTVLTYLDSINIGRITRPTTYEFRMLTKNELSRGNVLNDIRTKKPRFIGINDDLGDVTYFYWVTTAFTRILQELWPAKAPWETS